MNLIFVALKKGVFIIRHNFIDRYKLIIGWGTGGYFEKYGQSCKDNVSYLVDNNQTKWGNKKDNLKIKSPDSLEKIDEECLVVVFSEYFDEINMQVQKMGKFDVMSGELFCYLMNKNIGICCSEKSNIFLNEQGMDDVVCSIETIAYIASQGGGYRFVQQQTESLLRNRVSVLHIILLQYCMHDTEKDEVYVLVQYNKETGGLCRIRDIITYLKSCRGLIIHSPWYGINLINYIYSQMIHLQKCLYYLHDFSCICNQHFLPAYGKDCFNENGIDCLECEKGAGKRELIKGYSRLFYNSNVILVAPSEIVKKNVIKVYKDADIRVIPHYVYNSTKDTVYNNSKQRVAFIGRATMLKGWNDFKKIVQECSDRYEFYCMGECEDKIDNVTYVNVSVNSDEKHLCMSEALAVYKIDFAYLGSVWCETYSYTYFEAYEAGTYILTTEQSGNIGEEVKKNHNGYVGKDVDDIIVFLRTNQLKQIECKKIGNVRFNEKFLELLA